MSTESPQAAAVIITRGEQSKTELLNPEGVTIGRDASCDVVLDSPMISRKHAAIHQDPFGRWVIEDLGSHNGIWVDKNRVKSHPLSPGEKIVIGPFSLALRLRDDQEIAPDPNAGGDSTILVEVAEEEVRAGKPAGEVILSRDRLRQLHTITDWLTSLITPAQLYPEVCQFLATGEDAAAIVVRLPNRSEPLPPSPQILARHLGLRYGRETGQAESNLHLSRRLLEAVRRRGEAALARSGRRLKGDENDIALSVADSGDPRAVFCAPIAESAGGLDVLYLDLPEDEAVGDTLDYVQAVAGQVNLARRSLLLSEANVQRRVLDHQLGLAREIQMRLMPKAMGNLPGIDVALHYQPATWVGGDYCDIWPLKDGRLAFAVGDVAGKGLPAALVMANLQSALRATTSFCADPATVMKEVDQLLGERLLEGMFVTLVLGFLDAAGRLDYVNAGHILPLIVSSSGEVRELGRPENRPLGTDAGAFNADSAQLAPQSGLIVVTDGVTEAVSPSGEEFGTDRLRKAVAACRFTSSRSLVAAIVEAAIAFRQSLPMRDDLTVFALRRPAPGA